MRIGDIVYIAHGPLGGFYSPDEDAWPNTFQTEVPAGARGEIVGKHSLDGWWIARFYDDTHGDTGNKFVPVNDHHVTQLAPR